MSDTTVRPLRADEFDGWRASAQRNYTDNMIEAGGLDEDQANKKATEDFAALLTDGVETPTHSIYAIDLDGRPVGSLWLAERPSEQGLSLFVYEVFVDDALRGRGIGRAAMVFAEEEARRRGIESVSLNVFGGNAVARGLYTSLGYREVAVFMRKAL